MTEIRTGFSALEEWLKLSVTELTRQQEALNAINVFPVPDGDTGTNLLATMRTAHETLATQEPQADLGHHLAVAARQALGSAQGNSGSLISVFLLGMGESLAGIEDLTAFALAESLEAGRLRAWSALSEPVGGTILSVMAAASQAARTHASSQGRRSGQDRDLEALKLVGTLEAAWQASLVEAQHTQSRLKELTDIAVVDAGAVGFVIIINCLLAAVRGDEIDLEPYKDLPGYQEPGELGIEQIPATDGVEVVCTVAASALDAALMRAALDAVGESVVMSAMDPAPERDPEYSGYNHASASQGHVDGSLTWRVHVHVPAESVALDIISKAGEPTDVVVTPLSQVGATAPRPHRGAEARPHGGVDACGVEARGSNESGSAR
ncbi:DAK2 domain-containing protein [Pseudoglutamicibacter cumminsii]|uniref:DAK2 domain-containing protein n=1 Tax=Pseudoglutamicibacter cumminsii TaxID=156979 RepID=UPI0019560CD6|nr:DAK2 domain-containing protein [Pseudoglutamicibacter cumminsii]MBM7796993.1 dihydroxyacetone kinase-like predicted kinase [Pseudoglutamicibacter cumminsii]